MKRLVALIVVLMLLCGSCFITAEASLSSFARGASGSEKDSEPEENFDNSQGDSNPAQLVTYEDIQSGELAGKMVTIKCVIGEVDEDDVDVWYSGNERYYFEKVKLYELRYNDYLTDNERKAIYNWTSGEVYNITFKLYDDSSFGLTTIMKCVQIHEAVDVNEILQEYKDNFEEISCKSILRNPNKYANKRTYCKFNGTIIQRIEGEAYPEFLLCTAEGDLVMFRYDFSENEDLMLQNDEVTIYGYIPSNMVTITYDTLIGQNTVPFISVEHWDLH